MRVCRLTHPGECRRASVGIASVRVAETGVVQNCRGSHGSQRAGLDHHVGVTTTIIAPIVTTGNTVVHENLYLYFKQDTNRAESVRPDCKRAGRENAPVSGVKQNSREGRLLLVVIALPVVAS